MSPRLQQFIEGKPEGWLGLQINREKTRVIDLQGQGQSLDFLGYTLRYDRDRLGRDKRYWNLTPSRKALTRERAVLHEKLGFNRCHVPVPDLINRHLSGWAKYFSLGYPRQAMRDINTYVLRRFRQHLRRRSQRGWQFPTGLHLLCPARTGSLVKQLTKDFGESRMRETRTSGSMRGREAAVIGQGGCQEGNE